MPSSFHDCTGSFGLTFENPSLFASVCIVFSCSQCVLGSIVVSDAHRTFSGGRLGFIDEVRFSVPKEERIKWKLAHCI